MLAKRSEIRHAAEHAAEQAGFRHHGERRDRARRDQELHQFHAHALARQSREPGARQDRGMQPGCIGRAFAVPGMEAEEAQDAQIVLRDARRGVADEAHMAPLEIGKPADVVVHACRRARATARSW